MTKHSCLRPFYDFSKFLTKADNTKSARQNILLKSDLQNMLYTGKNSTSVIEIDTFKTLSRFSGEIKIFSRPQIFKGRASDRMWWCRTALKNPHLPHPGSIST